MSDFLLFCHIFLSHYTTNFKRLDGIFLLYREEINFSITLQKKVVGNYEMV